MPLFQLKLRPSDFIVTELLEEEPSGQGDFHYICLEKSGMTTFLLIDLLVKDFGLNRNMIGIAGLKDKHAITRQRISFSKRDVKMYAGGINSLLAWFRKKGKVIKATYHQTPLKLGRNAGNHFDIILMPYKKIMHVQKLAIEEKLEYIARNGMPNYFGDQRFGHGATNWKIGFDLLVGNIRNIPGDRNTLQEKRFKVQAFASYVFNKYLEERTKKGLLYEVIPGDIRSRGDEIPTGPIPGDDLKNATGKAGELEQTVYKKLGLTPDAMKRFKNYSLFGLRRSIVVIPKNLTYTWKGSELHLSFDLPSGSYATVLIDEIEKTAK